MSCRSVYFIVPCHFLIAPCRAARLLNCVVPCQFLIVPCCVVPCGFLIVSYRAMPMSTHLQPSSVGMKKNSEKCKKFQQTRHGECFPYEASPLVLLHRQLFVVNWILNLNSTGVFSMILQLHRNHFKGAKKKTVRYMVCRH